MATVNSMRTMVSILLLLALFSGRSHAFSLMNYLCNNGSSYGPNSTYHSNVVTLLASLSANASTSAVGFGTATLGRGGADQVWGLALCRGDINGSRCASCLAAAPDVAFGYGYCRGVKDVSIYYDRCLLRYSDVDFLASPADPAAPAQYGRSLEVNVTVDPGQFVGLAADLVGALADWAAHNSTSRYAAGVITSGVGFTTTSNDLVHTIYGLVQCTPDLTPQACQGCLDRFRDEMPVLFNGTAGAQVNAVWCNLRYEVFLIYDGSPVVSLVAPPPPPPPLAPAGQHANRAGGSGDAATVIAIILGVLVVILASTFIIYVWRKAHSKQYAEEDNDAGSLLFDLTTLKRATENFALGNKLGHGGFGAVYKGFLPNGRQIAVKRLDKASGQGLKELRNELLLVAKLRHNNLAKLLGVCLKGQEKLLVYEYLHNRSLDTFLFAPEKRLLLDWDTRYRIIYGTARGLLYLHEDSQIKIIHRDLKASNILLDADMNPKISDFGLARLFSGDKTTTLTSQVVGTLGYMAPEYAVLGHLSVKVDVYGFGVLVLEIVTGKKNTDMFDSAVDESGNLLSHVWDNWMKETLRQTIDPSLDGQAPESEVFKCIHLGLLCVQENPADRPTMLDVLVMLHGDASNFLEPSKPAFAYAYGDISSIRSNYTSGDPGTQRTGDQNEMSVSDFQPR